MTLEQIFMVSSIEAANRAVEMAEAAEPVLIRATGWSPTSIGIWIIVAILIPVVVAFFRFLPAMRKLRNEADGSLRNDLLHRLEKVEKEQRAERRECTRRLTAMQNKMDAVTRQFVQFQLTVVRHMPEELAAVSQRAAQNLMAIIAQDVEEFAPEPEPDEDAEPASGGPDA